MSGGGGPSASLRACSLMPSLSAASARPSGPPLPPGPSRSGGLLPSDLLPMGGRPIASWRASSVIPRRWAAPAMSGGGGPRNLCNDCGSTPSFSAAANTSNGGLPPVTVSLLWRANASVGNGVSADMGASPTRSDCRASCSPQDTKRNPRSIRGQILPRMCVAKVVFPFP